MNEKLNMIAYLNSSRKHLHFQKGRHLVSNHYAKAMASKRIRSKMVHEARNSSWEVANSNSSQHFLLAKATNSFLDNCECHLVSYITFCWLTLIS